MEKTIQINLGGLLFNIEEEAYNKLDEYLESIKKHYRNSGGEEILSDIESSIAEKFSDKTKNSRIITLSDVEEVIKVMGRVEDFEDEVKEENKKDEGSKKDELSAPKKLYRNPNDVIIAGVCSGIAAYFNIDAVFVRLVFIILLFANGIGLLAYVILWLIVPVAKTNSQKLEMQGKQVNLKKIEESIKEQSAKIKDGIKKNGKDKFVKFLYFPVRVVECSFSFLRSIIKGVWPVISILSGIGILILTLFCIAGVTFFAGIMIFHINSPYIISDVPLKEFAGMLSYYLSVSFLYFLITIPGVFMLFFGLTLLQRKNSFHALASYILIAIWMFSLVGFGLACFDLVPKAKNQIESIKNEEKIIKQYDYRDFDNLRIGIDGNVNIHNGEDFEIKASGGNETLDKLNFELKNGELTVNQNMKKEGICIFCYDQPVALDITLPALKSFVAYNNTQAKLVGFESSDLKVNSGEDAKVTVTTSALSSITSYVAGIHGIVDVIGSPRILNATLEGNGRLIAKELDAEEVIIKSDNTSNVELGGKVKKLTAELNGSSELDAFSLRTVESDIKTADNSEATIDVSEKLQARAIDHSSIIFLSEPKEIKKLINDNGEIRKAGARESGANTDIPNEEIEAAAIQDNGNLKIIFGNEKYAPYMSSARGLEMSPQLTNEEGNKIIYTWKTDHGVLVDNWDKPEYKAVMTTVGDKIYWTYLEREKFVEEKLPVHIYVEAVKGDSVIDSASVELEWEDNGLVRVKR